MRSRGENYNPPVYPSIYFGQEKDTFMSHTQLPSLLCLACLFTDPRPSLLQRS